MISWQNVKWHYSSINSVKALTLTLIATVAVTFAVEPPKPFGAVPSARQLKWHELEVIGMVNFSTITYYGKEWGYGDEDPARFNRTQFDARQIARAARSAGIRLLVIDAKHHGGFCLWTSKFTEYSVKHCPWKNGKGDMVKEIVNACRAEGIKVGVYLSPWDRNHKDYGSPEYVAYYHSQLRELLTNYGKIDEIWFDGANGGDGYYGGAKTTRKISANYYAWDVVMKIVRQLQPDACCFGREDIRWVGNESGFAGDPCWATCNNLEGDWTNWSHGDCNGKFWYPAEADVPLRDGWFWHPGGKTKTAAHLVNLYFASVGRNSTMDIGIAPDRRGLIDEPDAAALRVFGERIRAIFANNLAESARPTASNVRGNSKAYAATNVLVGKTKHETYWATDDGVRDADIILDFGKPAEFSVVSLREPIQLGHRINKWAIDMWQDGRWQEFASGVGIGARRLWRGQLLTSDKIRLRLADAFACPALSEVAVYVEPEASRKESGGAVATRFEPGLPREHWRVVYVSNEGEGSGLAKYAIDGRTDTFWHTHITAGRQPSPQSLIIDMGAEHELTGFLYLPRLDNCTVGNVTGYAFAVSLDGQAWTDAALGEFGNMQANPIQQKVTFDKPARARYFKFTATSALDGCANAAEIGVLAHEK